MGDTIKCLFKVKVYYVRLRFGVCGGVCGYDEFDDVVVYELFKDFRQYTKKGEGSACWFCRPICELV